MLTDQLGMGLLISLKDAFSANARTIQNNVASLDAGMSAAAKRMQWSTDQISGGAKMMGVGLAAMAAPSALIASSMATQKSLGALAAEGVKDLGMLEDAATSFTNKWAGYNKVQFLDSAWEIKGAFANLTDEAVGAATGLTALTAKATRASLESMTGAMTSGYGVFRGLNKEMNDQDWFAGFSGAMTQTVNVFRTDGEKMALALRQIGAIGSGLEIPMVEQMATLGALQTKGMGAEQAGTNLRALYLNMTRAGKELGFQTLGPDNRLLSMPELLKNIQGRFSDLADPKTTELLRKPFGDEGLLALTSLSGYAKELPDGIAEIGKAFASGSAATLESARKADNTFAGSIGVMGNRIRNLADELGKTQGQWARPFVELGNSALEAAQKMAKAHPVLVGVPVAAAGALGAITVAAGAARFAVGALVFSFDGMRMAAASAGASATASIASIRMAANTANASMAAGNAGEFFSEWSHTGPAVAPQAAVPTGLLGRDLFAGASIKAKAFFSDMRAGLASMAVRGRGLLGSMFLGLRAAPAVLTGLFSAGSLAAAWTALSGAVASVAAAAWPVTAVIAAVIAGVYVLWNVGRGFCQGFAAALRPVYNMIRDALAPSVTGVGSAFSAVGRVIGSVFSALGGALTFVGKAVGWLVGMGLKSVLYGIASGVKAVFLPITTGVKIFLWGVSSIWSLVKGLGRGIGEVLGPTFGYIYSEFKNTVTGVGSAFSGAWAQLSNLFGSIGSALRELGAAFGVTFGGSGMGGMLQAIGKGLGWVVGTWLKPMIYLVVGPLWLACKAVALTVSTIAWAFKNAAYYAQKVAHYASFGKVSNPVWQDDATPAQAAQAVKAVVPSSVAAIPAAPRWYAAPARAAAAVAVTMAPMAQPAMAEPQSRPAPRMLMMPVRSAPVEQYRRGDGGQAPQSEQNDLLRALLAEMQAGRNATERLAERPIDVRTSIDGRQVGRAVANQNRIDAVRTGT